MAVVTLVRKAQAQFPQERRREGLTTAQIKPVIEQLQKWEQEAREAVVELVGARHRIAELQGIPTRDQVLDGLTDDELTRRFRDRFLDTLSPADIVAHFSADELLSGMDSAKLLGAAVERAFRDMMSRDLNPTVALPPILMQHLMQQNGNGHATNGHATKVVRKSLVFLGLKPDQQRRMTDRIGDLAHVHCVDKNRQDRLMLPARVDLCFIWANFTPRSYTNLCKAQLKPEQIQTHSGGFNELLDKAIRACTK